MATRRTDDERSIVVAGDVILDWNLMRVAERSEESVRASYQPGGAALLGHLIRDVALGNLGFEAEVTVPEEPGQISPTDARFSHRYAVWDRFSEDGQEAWRVKDFLGVDRASTNAGDPAVKDGPERADLIVLHDSGAGFRDRPKQWPQAVRKLSRAGARRPWIVLRMEKPVAQGKLWERLQPFADRMIVVIHIDDLRLGEVRISRELSWERTAQDLLWELTYNPNVNDLARCAHVIVSFTTAGALVFSRRQGTKEGPDCQLVFDPAVMERMWNEAHPGKMIGGLSSLTASIARQVMLNPQDPDVTLGVQRGIAAIRQLDEFGYTTESVRGRPHLVFPTGRIVQELASTATPFAMVAVRDPAQSPDSPRTEALAEHEWTILRSRFTDGLEQVAFDIVKHGPEQVLVNVPIGSFGKLLTVDRNEIEGLRSIRSLIREYGKRSSSHQGSAVRPLYIAVFGPPGSGKSFVVKQVANAVLRGEIQDITFNISQFDDPRELVDALHRVRDISLGGKLPLVFWDEFDTTRLTVGGPQPLGWLPHFLAPMQDGEFQDGQLAHPVGAAVFVFAGGTSTCLQEFAKLADPHFRAVKGPDFVSRLSGYVDVRGQNPIPGAGQEHLIRRAVLLRSLLQRNVPQIFPEQVDGEGSGEPDIDLGVLRALLLTKEYRHGARSMESILTMSALSGMSRFERSALPSESELELHVDTSDFFALVHRLDLEGEMLEHCAEAAHILYCARRLAEGDTWAGRDEDYLLGSPRLAGFVGLERDPRQTNPKLVPFVELDEARKNDYRRFVREIPNKLHEVGYLRRPARNGEPPLELTSEEVQLIAEVEHERWLQEKLAAGWKWALGPEDPDRLTTPNLLPWRDLSDAERSARYGPDSVARLGKGELSKQVKSDDEDRNSRIASILAIDGYTAVKEVVRYP